jgi:DNA-binding NarL/FixJ family response regulator
VPLPDRPVGRDHRAAAGLLGCTTHAPYPPALLLGFALPNESDLGAATRLLAEPLSALTSREREVLGLMAEGRTNTAIGERLFLSERTVEGNVRRIFDKLGLADTPQDNRRVLAVLAFLRA